MPRFLKTPSLDQAGSKAIKLPVSIGNDAPPALADGMVRYNTQNSCIEFAINSVWRKIAKVGNTIITSQDTVGDGIATDFTLNQTVADETDIVVFVGGVYQQPTSNYTIATALGVTTLTFTSPPPAPGVSNPNRIVILYGVNSTDAV